METENVWTSNNNKPIQLKPPKHNQIPHGIQVEQLIFGNDGNTLDTKVLPSVQSIGPTQWKVRTAYTRGRMALLLPLVRTTKLRL